MGPRGSSDSARSELTAFMSPLGAWALSLGTSIGWGSFVVTSNMYLSQAGPLGSALGMFVGAAIMLVIARNYHYMMNRYPDAGGVYSYAKHAFGHDHGFLVAWFLALTYIAILWANATSLPLFARYFLGDMFEFGYLYSLFGYDVYLGEVMVVIVAIALVGLLCAKEKRLTQAIMIGLAFVFVLGIVACFAVAVLSLDVAVGGFDPLVLPDSSVLGQVIGIACMSPWAFIGFENISHMTEEFAFPRAKSFRIFVVSIASTTLLYVFVTLLSVTAYPARYGNWLEYLGDLGNLQGIEALPPFYAAYHYLGDMGVYVLMAALLALIVTSLIGNLTALSRLLYALSKDGVLPSGLSALNAKAIPGNAIVAIVAVSVFIPLLGRTAIGWIVDVTTIGATIVYAFVSAAVFSHARKHGESANMAIGFAGVVLMVFFGLMLQLPNLTGTSSMASESLILFMVWAVLGFVYFRMLLQRDSENRYGKSVVVWIGLLALILFVSMAWMGQSDQDATDRTVTEIQAYLAENDDSSERFAAETLFIEEELASLRVAKMQTTLFTMGLFGAALFLLLGNFSFLRKREEENERKLGAARAAAYTDALTGVKSKHAYGEWELELNTHITDGTAPEFAVVVCDVNGLKQVNDTLGHEAGNKYIREACSLVCTSFKHSPVFRVGGDEFAVIMKGDDFENRETILERFDGRVEENIGTGGVVVAAGIAVFDPAHDNAVSDVFERADSLMYDRKRALKEMGSSTRE